MNILNELSFIMDNNNLSEDQKHDKLYNLYELAKDTEPLSTAALIRDSMRIVHNNMFEVRSK